MKWDAATLGLSMSKRRPIDHKTLKGFRLFRLMVRFARAYFNQSLRWVVPRLPEAMQQWIASSGHADLVRKNLDFTASIFETPLRIEANSKYQIEINATSRKIPGHEIFGCFHRLVTPGAVCIDVGANVGTYALGFCALGASRLIAGEPGQYFPRLIRNIELNGLEDRITALNIGISSDEGSFDWVEDRNNPGNAHLLRPGEIYVSGQTSTALSGQRFTVSTLSLDTLCESQLLAEVSLIKIDVEGRELDVVLSGAKTITRFKPLLLIET